MRVVVTGAAGTIGRTVSAGLRERGHEVVALDQAYAEGVVRVDVSNVREMTVLVEGADGVVHLAGYPSEGSLETALHTRGNARTSSDETLRVMFVGLLKVLDDHELYERAVVPAGWHAERVHHRAELEASIARQVHAAFAEARKFVSDWQPRWDELLAPRHRRRIPLPDDLLTERIARLRRIVGA